MLLIKKEAEKASGWTGEEGVLNLTALGDGHDDAGGCAAAGQRGEAELRGEAAGGGHGGMAAAARSSRSRGARGGGSRWVAWLDGGFVREGAGGEARGGGEGRERATATAGVRMWWSGFWAGRAPHVVGSGIALRIVSVSSFKGEKHTSGTSG